MRISFVVAMDCHRGIGLNNQLPWRLPADLHYFRQLTSYHTVLMGRKTYESIGKPLPNRRNLVLTKQLDYEAPGSEIVHDIEQALNQFPNEELFVIGGAEVYRMLYPRASRLYITYIHHAFAVDAYFPAFEEDTWHLTSSVMGEQNEKNPYAYEFRVYDKV